MRKVIIFFFPLFLPFIMKGQDSTLTFTKLNEIPNTHISSIVQDQNGFIWLGTQDGLIRYDGYRIDVVHNSPENSNTIPSNWIKDIVIDSDEIYWLATQGGGLSKFSVKEMLFTNLTDLFEGRMIHKVEALPKERLIFDSDEGVFIYDKANNFEKILIGDYIRLLEVQDQYAWFMNDTMLYQYDTDLKKVIFSQKFKDRLSALVVLPNQQLLISTEKETYLYHQNHLIKKLIVEDQITQATKSNNNKVYLSSKNKLFEFDIDNHKINEVNTHSQFSDKEIITIYRDRQNILWVGTNKGLFKESKYIKAFKSEELIEHHARRIMSHNNQLFIGGKKGLFIIDNNHSEKHVIKDANVKAINLIDETIWVGGINGDIYKIDENGSVKEMSLVNENSEGLLISGFFKDKKERIWVSTWRGIFVLNSRGEVLHFFRLKTNSNFGYAKIVQMLIDKKDRLWLATIGYGIHQILNISDVKLTGELLKTNNFRKEEHNFNSITSNIILSIEEDKNGVIWFGLDVGAIKYNESTNDFTRLRDQNRLFDEKVMTIRHDNDNNLWITTINNGICVYNQEKDKIRYYTKEDGLISNSFLYTSGYYNNIKNKLYFGTIEGVQTIDFSKSLEQNIDIRPTITGFNISNNTAKKVHPFQSPSKTIINLDYTQNDFTVSFSGLDFTNPKKVKYAYKLDDINWQTTHLQSIYFTNVSSGKHELRIKASYNSDVLNSNPSAVAILNIYIKPPWYKTWWSYLLYGTLFLVTLYRIVDLVIKQKLAVSEAEKIKELDEVKSKMYANISHEFRTPLTIISGLSKMAFEENTDSKINERIRGIQQSSSQLLNLVNQMLELVSLDAKKIEPRYKRGDIVSFIKKCVELYKSYSDSKQKQLLFKSDLPNLVMDIDSDKLQKIINNLVSNALKFTPEEGEISVHLFQNKNTIIIKVSDSGKGIHKKDLPFIFDRHYRTFDVNNNLGSGIGMAITKELVGLLGGNITVESKLNIGSVFTITLPINNTIKQESELVYKLPFINENSDTVKVNDEISQSAKPSILVVEDNTDISNYIMLLLQDYYNIYTAKNGKEGLKISNNNNIDFIISDIMMPEMNGYEFCKHIKNNVNTSHIPFIMISAKAEVEARLDAYKLGIDAYLSKPFNGQELMLILKNLLEKRQEQINYFSKLLQLKKNYENKLSINQIDLNLIKSLQEIVLDKINETSVDALAKHLLISRTQLHIKVKALTGMSVTKYIHQIRIEKAKDLLHNSELHINEVAYEVGFEDPAYFSRIFKKLQGVSPAKYRQ